MKKRYVITASAFDKRGRLICTANNSYNDSSSLMRYYAFKTGNHQKVYNHAEIRCLEIAILKMKQKVARLVVMRWDSFGNLKDSSPCCICREAIKDFKIPEVYYSKEDGIVKL